MSDSDGMGDAEFDALVADCLDALAKWRNRLNAEAQAVLRLPKCSAD